VGTRVTGHDPIDSSFCIELPTSNLGVGFEVRDGEYQGHMIFWVVMLSSLVNGDGGSRFLWNTDTYIPDSTALQPRRQ
jgi:hypothetical protein